MIVTPSENLSLGCQETREQVTANDLDNWNLEVNLVRNRGDVFQMGDLVNGEFILLDFLLAFDRAARHSASHHKGALIVRVGTQNHSVDVAWRDLVDHRAEHVVPHRFRHHALYEVCLVLFDNVISEAQLRTRVVPPHVDAVGLVEIISHRDRKELLLCLVTFSVDTLRGHHDVVAGLWLQIGHHVLGDLGLTVFLKLRVSLDALEVHVKVGDRRLVVARHTPLKHDTSCESLKHSQLTDFIGNILKVLKRSRLQTLSVLLHLLCFLLFEDGMLHLLLDVFFSELLLGVSILLHWFIASRVGLGGDRPWHGCRRRCHSWLCYLG